MINNDYLVDMSYVDDSGSYCDFLPIKGENQLGFKSFKLKSRAVEAYKIQKKLSKFNLSPNTVTEVCKIPYSYDPELLKYWTPDATVTSWGYITEKAMMLDESDMPYSKLQNLVDIIKEKTHLKFWDCHWTNIGYIKDKLVCIDTGKESFTPYCNAWGFEEPGPKCPYCNKYQCYCSVVLPNENVDYI